MTCLMSVMSRRQLLYFDWLVQNIIKRICVMPAYFLFNVIGLMTHIRMMNEHHVLTLGASMCMINGHTALIIGMYD